MRPKKSLLNVSILLAVRQAGKPQLLLFFIFPDEDYFIDYGESSGLAAKKWDSSEETDTLRADVCVPRPLGGIDWILSVCQPDHGWREETHRAVIALAINNWEHLTPREVRQIELQLEVELTKALLRY
ncbi:uncharacterized protein NPIL_329991 [Nephila pilipes]|uniref:Uncharacterized protein n=1 Tax=Nephila pilipes TaxID=299642 RepID=A0A8X6TDE5_NEPPI|nr:uncharacterized protein NPIL_329991 [Nephila pilipes]